MVKYYHKAIQLKNRLQKKFQIIYAKLSKISSYCKAKGLIEICRTNLALSDKIYSIEYTQLNLMANTLFILYKTASLWINIIKELTALSFKFRLCLCIVVVYSSNSEIRVLAMAMVNVTMHELKKHAPIILGITLLKRKSGGKKFVRVCWCKTKFFEYFYGLQICAVILIFIQKHELRDSIWWNANYFLQWFQGRSLWILYFF